MKWLCFLLVPAALAQTLAQTPAQTPAQPTAQTQAQPTAQTPAQPARNPFQEAMEKQRAAVAIQRDAVRKQAEMAAQWRTPATSLTEATEVPEAECSPIAEVELTPLIDAAAQTHSVEPKLLRAVIERESGFRPCAVSPKGAQGLMQLMPDTAGQLGVEDAFDPKQNIDGGARFLKQLLDKYKGDLPLALGAYNAGPSTVDQTGKVPDIPETRDYVAAILKKMLAAPASEPQPVPPIVPPR
ncbi:MAG TPA: lytic transglycosylase domain-containing protein [Candidatus Acidoferrales bacterium]|jgi:soluble lytic murein transglycosylase-like protein|nr:lytic transglycosylase domain-containing protein [Candidatus Acidoferrales bacterium]